MSTKYAGKSFLTRREDETFQISQSRIKFSFLFPCNCWETYIYEIIILINDKIVLSHCKFSIYFYKRIKIK